MNTIEKDVEFLSADYESVGYPGQSDEGRLGMGTLEFGFDNEDDQDAENEVVLTAHFSMTDNSYDEEGEGKGITVQVELPGPNSPALMISFEDAGDDHTVFEQITNGDKAIYRYVVGMVLMAYHMHNEGGAS